MTVALAPDSVDLDVEELDEDDVHLWCCDPDVALCGVSLEGDLVPEGDRGSEDGECRLCAYVWDESLPCPVAGCPWSRGVGP